MATFEFTELGNTLLFESANLIYRSAIPIGQLGSR